MEDDEMAERWEDRMNIRASGLLAGVLFVTAAVAAERIAAQTGATTATPETTLITLGTRGGPVPTKDRGPSSNLLVVKPNLSMFDAAVVVPPHIVPARADFRKAR